MITVSPAAAAQIKKSAEETDSEGMCLRIAARVTPDEALDYGMGFDEAREDDLRNQSEGIDIVVSPSSADLLHGTYIDYVQLETGEYNFIFQNPNDPAHKPPQE
ncbi:MAG: iron-sulfur cluster assembly accessory protein [Gammaproteobacteria bacterium]|nr:iron-sulfur cluster assembly accessory protein [Gammaproteobacteria bacterium]